MPDESKGRDKSIDQEAVAEKIMQLHKDSVTGFLDWSQLHFDDTDNPVMPPGLLNVSQRLEILRRIKSTLIQDGLIENYSPDRTVITKKGEAFTTFEAERKKQARKQREERVTSWPQRNWLIVSLLGYVAGIATIPIGNLIDRKILQGTSQSQPATPSAIDTSNKTDPSRKDSLNKNIKR